MRGSFVNNTNKAVDDAYSELLPTTGKRKGVLQSALSDKEWGQRLNPPSRKAKEVKGSQAMQVSRFSRGFLSSQSGGILFL